MTRGFFASAWRFLAWLFRKKRPKTPGPRSEGTKVATRVEEAFDFLSPAIEQHRLFTERHANARMQLYRLSIDLAGRKEAYCGSSTLVQAVLDDIVAREDELIKSVVNATHAVETEIISVLEQIQEANRQLQEGPRPGNYGLFRVSGWENEDRAGDVIFVHGLNGDAVTTWCYDGDAANYFWPRWLGQELEKVAIYSLGYDARALRLDSVNLGLAEHAVGALSTLSTEGIGHRPIVFVCHSMGGLVVAEILRRCSNVKIDPDWRKIRRRTVGVAFLATPHRGAQLATVLDHIAGLVGIPCDVGQLQAYTPALVQLVDWFRENVDPKRIHLRSYYETKMIGPTVVVDRDSADLGIPGVPPIPVLDADHVSICKPRSNDASVYREVRSLVKKALRL